LISVYAGFHMHWMRRRIAANRKAIAVLLTWVNAETKRVYKDRRDTSGAIFEEYAALYTTHTSCDLVEILGGQDFVDRITAKANRLQKVRPFQGHIIPALMKAVDLDMAYRMLLKVILLYYERLRSVAFVCVTLYHMIGPLLVHAILFNPVVQIPPLTSTYETVLHSPHAGPFPSISVIVGPRSMIVFD
jgi:hypothetical protein